MCSAGIARGCSPTAATLRRQASRCGIGRPSTGGSAREPVAMITGHREFWGLDFQVTPATLVPRPETEMIVEEALRFVPGTAT